MGVARVCHFYDQRAYLGFVKQVEDVLQRHVVNVGALAIDPADVQAHPIPRDVGEGVIDGPNMQSDRVLKGRQVRVLI